MELTMSVQNIKWSKSVLPQEINYAKKWPSFPFFFSAFGFPPPRRFVFKVKSPRATSVANRTPMCWWICICVCVYKSVYTCVYVHMRTHTCVYVFLSTYGCIHTRPRYHLHSLCSSVCMSLCTYIHICVCLHVELHERMCVSACAYVCVRVCICMYVCTRLYMCAYVRVYIFHMYVCISF